MSGKTYLRNQNFFKRNYFEALKYILPGYLYEDDVADTPKAEDPIDTIINSQIDVASDFSSVLNVSAVSNSAFSSINTLSGIAPYFVKQNELTNITTQSFEDKILSYFDRKFSNFESQDEFDAYVTGTLLPAIDLNNPDTARFASIGTASAIHNYLITNLSWMYFLNTSGPSYDPSSYVRGLLVSSLYNGKPVRINDGINGLSEYLWRNASGTLYPSALFASGSRFDLSGTQQLDKFKTWNDVIYSPLFADSSDFRVRDKFETYIESRLKSSSKIEDGPFARLIRALSFFAFDVNNETEEISTLYDIDDCPDEYLPLIAELIGWDLFGNIPDRWRLQLRNAVAIYKTVGTKRAIQSTVNTIFPKNSFPIESKLTELWESYVPYLIYYALATESSYFKSFQTWTPALASQMGIEKYSTSSMDDNIRLAVDKIILETIQEFPERFPINVWISENNAVFNYRGRDYPVPPFEEYPYYVNTELTSDMVSFISDRCACFGVTQEFALDLSSYITSNALNVDDEPRANSWLIFTSGYNSPPNLDRLIRNLNDNRFDYASLWSGKSSHFKLVLDADSFDFSKKDLDSSGTGDAVAFAAKAVAKVAPAHAIPLVTLQVSAGPDTMGFEGSSIPYIRLDSEELDQGGGNNVFASGIYFNTYKRGINTGGNVVGKAATQSLVSPEFISQGGVSTSGSFITASSIGSVPRNSLRRRSFEKVMPFNGYYDRTGFNMPVSFDMASGLSGIPLGLVPSSLSYTPVSSHINLPAIWSQCEGLNSDNTYYEYDVSNTQNVRGQSANFQANTDRSTDRGQLPGIYAAMHRIGERRKYLDADLIRVGIPAIQEDIKELAPFSSVGPGVASALSILEDNLTNWTSGVTVSYVNSATNGDITFVADPGNKSANLYAFPANLNNYYNFEFGRDFHRLYRIYQDNFQWHRLSPDIQDKDGANVFSHTFGPLLYNHDLEVLGSLKSSVASSFASPEKLTVTSTEFTGAGSFLTSSTSSLVYVSSTSSYQGSAIFERVSSGIVDAVELVLTSGTEDDSSFSLIRVPSSQRKSYEDPFLYDNTMVIMRSGANAATRVRFDISKYDADSSYPIANNFLSPEHEFKVNLNSLISRDSGTTLGGRSVGIWIHTRPEGEKMWSFTPQGDWVQHDKLISRQDIFSRYGHTKQFESKPHNPQSTTTFSNLQCIDQIPTNRTSPIIGLAASSFEDFEVTFNTRNREIRLPRDYQKSYEQLHRLDQNYVIEVFMSPGAQPDEFMLLDTLTVQDMTMKKLSEIFAAGTLSDPLCVLGDLKRGCAESRVDLTKQDIFDVFKHFNNIAGKNAATAYASRDKAKTETIMKSEGGSRVDYRQLFAFNDVTTTPDSANAALTVAINAVIFET